MIVSHQLDHLLPHRAPMILLDELISSRADQVIASVAIKEGIPFFRKGSVPVYVGLEYMAQACALWSGCLAKENNEAPAVGYLLGTRDFHATDSHFNSGEELTVVANLEYLEDGMGRFDCSIKRNDQTVATAHVSVYQP